MRIAVFDPHSLLTVKISSSWKLKMASTALTLETPLPQFVLDLAYELSLLHCHAATDKILTDTSTNNNNNNNDRLTAFDPGQPG